MDHTAEHRTVSRPERHKPRRGLSLELGLLGSGRHRAAAELFSCSAPTTARIVRIDDFRLSRREPDPAELGLVELGLVELGPVELGPVELGRSELPPREWPPDSSPSESDGAVVRPLFANGGGRHTKRKLLRLRPGDRKLLVTAGALLTLSLILLALGMSAIRDAMNADAIAAAQAAAAPELRVGAAQTPAPPTVQPTSQTTPRPSQPRSRSGARGHMSEADARRMAENLLSRYVPGRPRGF